MTQYYYAPKANQSGAAPPEISKEWDENGVSTLTVNLDAQSVPYVNFGSSNTDQVANAFYRIIQDAQGTTIPQVADAEFYMEFLFNSLTVARNGDFRFCARADLSSSGYALGLRRPDLKIISIVSGSRSDILKQTASPVLAAGVLYSAKAKLTGTTLEAKFWEAGASEPAYQTAPANSTITAAGYVGLYSVFPGNLDTRLYKFSVATGGDPVLTEDPAAATPTITDINTNNQVIPGATETLTGTNLTNATGVNIGIVSQTGFSVVSDTSVTFTGTRGGNPYNKDLTATLLSPDGNATITVQQVPEAGTFAVTAASPNTTDDASLWTGLVDTATGDPVTVVDGDQAWVNTLLDGLAIAPDGTITANETGTFTVQFWRASEGVWGSDQAVSFTLPSEPGTPSFVRGLKKALTSTLKKSLRANI